MGILFDRTKTENTYTWPETRTQRLNRVLLEVQPEICVDRARLVTQSYRGTEGEAQIVRRAKALDKVLSEMSIFIQDEQVLVGNQASRLRWAPLYPETEATYLERELDLFATRDNDRLLISDEIKRELREDIFPYWRGKTTEDVSLRRIPSDTIRVMKANHPPFHAEIHLAGGFGHLVPNFRLLLEKGFGGLKREAEDRLAALDMADPASIRKSHFYQAQIILTAAVSKFICRYAKLARDTAQNETRPSWQRELNLIEETCEAVAENPPQTFLQAIQLVWFAHLMTYIEQDGLANSPGRIDQYLYPYYRRDIDEGRVTDEDVQQLLELFWIKCTEIMRAYDFNAAQYFSGFSIAENVLLGGLDADGNDVTNELSYLSLEAEANTRLSQPNVSVRVHPGTPDRFILRACQLVIKGRTTPQFFNDLTGIQMLLNDGVSLPDARNYSISGCVEPIPDNCIGLTNASMSNLGKALELALNDGRCRLCGELIGPETGDPRQFKAFSEVLAAFRTQVEYYVRHMVTALNVIQSVHAEIFPLPFFSLIVADCMERGMDVTWGGARYNFTGPQGVGSATAADSLTAIETLVFDSHVLTMKDLIGALDRNFDGQEELRQTLMRKAPKYGQDNARADAMMRTVCRVYSDAVTKYRDPRGGRYRAGLYSVPSNVPLGRNVGALPDGRLATMPLTDGVSPRHGVEVNGVTGVLRSAARIDHVAASNGSSLNIRLEVR